MPQPEFLEDDNGMFQVCGTVEQIVFCNADNGYTVCDIGVGDELYTACGAMPEIGEGDEILITGKWVQSPKYGKQIQVVLCERKLPSDTVSIRRFLSSGFIKGIGRKTAARLVERFGTDTFDVIENHPEWLSEIPGISLSRAREISEDFRDKTGIRAVMMFFRDYFCPTLVSRIYKQYGLRAIDMAKADPYLFCREVDGIGFERADRFAQGIGVKTDADERLRAGLWYMLETKIAGLGHVCYPMPKLLSETSVLLGVPEERTREILLKGIEEGRFVRETREDTDFIYSALSYRNEVYIAERLKQLDRGVAVCSTANARDLIGMEELRLGITYADQQKRAILAALQSGVMILTGGPGTGKTTVVKALLDIFRNMNFEVALCAPTGRAAKRLSESTGQEASTVHRLLEYQAPEAPPETSSDTPVRIPERRGSFNRDENNPLQQTVIILDEASMMDCSLMSALLHALKRNAHLILIGDADQLPSVGAGDVLRDLIASHRFATVCLSEIFRQAQKSRIVTNAHLINEGKMPVLDDRKNDFFYLDRRTDASIAATVTELLTTRLPKAYGSLTGERVQVITPSRKGETGTENLNKVLQDALNPKAEGKKEILILDRVFRDGDRVMQIRNNYDLSWKRDRTNLLGQVEEEEGTGVFNGDIGTIRNPDPKARTLTVLFDDGRVADYEEDALEDLDYAYAVTVHKSQGSEYGFVIIPVGDVPPLLLTRNLLYTAVTRARTMVILVGKQEQIRRMVENNRPSVRYTGLCARLRGQTNP